MIVSDLALYRLHDYTIQYILLTHESHIRNQNTLIDYYQYWEYEIEHERICSSPCIH
jgi:hypothetical protein